MTERLRSTPHTTPPRGDELRKRTERDLQRLQRRERDGNFFRAIAVIGGVGWPIVALGVGGALLGRRLDRALGGGVRFTLALLLLGTALGSFLAFSSLGGRR